MENIDVIEQGIKSDLKHLISERIQEEIDEKVKDFRWELESRKDNYIAEIMKGIRINHEQIMGSKGINYSITFENIYKIEREEK